jgi:hypothetical protein
MKTGGIVIMIAGITLFVWHFFMGEWDSAHRFGYASHQVMSVDSFILVIVGAIFYLWGRRRHRGRSPKPKPDPS